MSLFIYINIANLFYKKEYKMGIIELLILSIGLGMDAFAVAICKGISMKK